MKYLVYGHKGWIGGQVVSLLQNEGNEVILGESRVDDEVNVERELIQHYPERVITLTGRTHGEGIQTIDYLEKPGKLVENLRDNLYGPLILAITCKRLKIHLTYLGTGCIFNDEEDATNFNEDDKPNFFGSSYSIVKGFTDRLMHQFDEVLNVRIRMPISDTVNLRNFITKITKYEKICSIANSMTVLPELLPVMIDMTKKKLTGTINLTNPGTITHNEILTMYKDIIDPSFTWRNFTINEQDKILSSKRSNNALNTDKLQSLYPNVKPIKEAVYECLQRMKNIMHAPYIPTAVLLTGGCGFIGSNTLTYLANKYTDIVFVNLDKLDYCSSEKNVRITSNKNYSFYKGDINDSNLVNQILNTHQIDTVIHFAAQTHVDNSFGNSVQFTRDNVLGTHNLLEACREYGNIKRFVHISTDEVYGQTEDHQTACCEETSLLNPSNPYAATKASAEFLVRSYRHSFNLPTIITRGNNVYGPYQYPEKVIPKFIMHLLNNEKCTIQGTGSSRRKFVYVDDMAKAVEKILIHGILGQIYNIGTDTEFTVMEVARMLINKLKPGDKFEDWITYIKDRNFNDCRYDIKTGKITNLGWREETSFEEGLQLTIDYYIRNKALYDKN